MSPASLSSWISVPIAGAPPSVSLVRKQRIDIARVCFPIGELRPELGTHAVQSLEPSVDEGEQLHGLKWIDSVDNARRLRGIARISEVRSLDQDDREELDSTADTQAFVKNFLIKNREGEPFLNIHVDGSACDYTAASPTDNVCTQLTILANSDYGGMLQERASKKEGTEELKPNTETHTSVSCSLTNENEELNLDVHQETYVTPGILASALKRYGKTKAIRDGRYLHAKISKHGYDRSSFLGNVLIEMYGNCGSVVEAQTAFDKILRPDLFSWNLMIKAYIQNGTLDDAKSVFWSMPQRDVVSWTAMIRACTRNGHDKEALRLFRQMQLDGVQPNKVTFVCILDACSNPEDSEEGRMIHAAVVHGGYELDVYVGTALVTMHGKCGSPHCARNVFYKMPHRDVISWNAMIAACAQSDLVKEALAIFYQMQQEGILPDKFSFISILGACGSHVALQEGTDIHATIVSNQYESDIEVSNALVSMYGKCGCLDKATKVFFEMAKQDVVSWSAMIAAYSQNGHGKKALELFQEMLHNGFKPSKITMISILDACADLEALEEGCEIHASIVENGYEQDVVVGNALVNLYGKCCSLDAARTAFNRMHQRDVVSWNILLAQNRHGIESLKCFHQMQLEGVKPDKLTYMYVIDTCAFLGALSQGQMCHAAIKKSKYEKDAVLCNALINMYAKCRSIDEARIVFRRMAHRDIVSWNAMIGACVQNGRNRDALEIFHQMEIEGIKPDMITFICALDGCDNVGYLDEGIKIHTAIAGSGYTQNVVLANALISMYGKCSSLEKARFVFSSMTHRNIVSWNAMLTACVQNNHGQEALSCFRQMKREGMDPDRITFICVVDACASMTAVEEGQEIHAAAQDGGWESDTVVCNALINMYGKCGNLSKARSVLSNMAHRNVVSWSSMIAACAQNGHSTEALSLFHEMQLEGVKPNSITFICVLTACSQAGRVADGRKYFVSMNQDHGISCTVEHYVCMIDLLGRAGHLDEAEDLINKMPFKNNIEAWLSLVGACRIHSDIKRGVRAAYHCIQLDPENTAPYTMLSNIYAAAGRWDDAAKVREALKKIGMDNEEGESHTKLNKMVQDFVLGGVTTLWKQELQTELGRLSSQVREKGKASFVW